MLAEASIMLLVLVGLHAAFVVVLLANIPCASGKTPQALEERQNIWNGSSSQAQVL